MASAQESNEETSNTVPTADLDHKIALVDTTKPIEADTAETVSDDGTVLIETPTRLSKRLSISTGVRDQRNKWKYGRYTAERATGRARTSEEDGIEEEAESEDSQELSSRYGKNRISRGKQRVSNKYNSFRGRRTTRLLKDPNSEIDVLFENQRGLFLFGHPLFSSNALWQLDTPAWSDNRGKKSSVNITNAQVPDPSWIWVWKNWFVDMSGDVDEEGWEYSFFFRGCAWHGTHPWFHSFVRRRRWIRKRTRKDKEGAANKVFGKAHMMNQDYFTIHSGFIGGTKSGVTSPAGDQRSVLMGSRWEEDEAESWDEKDISDIATLITGLKESSIDSERISLIRRFLKQDGEDLYYLADEMPKILSYFFYEASCRRLLAMLTDTIDEARTHREEHERDEKSENEAESRRIDSLMKAAKAVDEQCRKLEYWSDVREITRDGKVLAATDTQSGWGPAWQGLDSSGPENQDTPTPTKEREERDFAVQDDEVAEQTDVPERPASPNDVFEEKTAPVIANVFDSGSESVTDEGTQERAELSGSNRSSVEDRLGPGAWVDGANSPHDSYVRTRSRSQSTVDNDEGDEDMTEVEPIPTTLE